MKKQSLHTKIIYAAVAAVMLTTSILPGATVQAATQNAATPSWQLKADAVIKEAFAIQDRVQYVYGKNSPSTMEFDCSSFTKYLYKHNTGVNLWWGARKQSLAGPKVAKANLRKGDLVFLSTPRTAGANDAYHRIAHVAIYIGNGKIIHNVTPRVDVVVSDLNSTYYKRHYVTATRVLK